jgi:hypothetical protein
MNAAVLVIGFNRPEHLIRVLERVREADPPRVYIAIDGPRNETERASVDACRDVARAIHWAPTELRFQESNLGCQEGVIDAVSWLLTKEPEGIVVEDDSVPDFSFFRFCDDLLNRYRDDRHVLAISGESRVPNHVVPSDTSYRFTYMGPAGAWATWSDRWTEFAKHRLDANPCRTYRGLAKTRHNAFLRRAHWIALSFANRTRVMDSWAYPFMIFGIANHQLTATPNVNVVADHGIGSEARHMQSEDPLHQNAQPLAFPLRHPPLVELDERAEQWSEDHEIGFGAQRLLQHGSNFVRRLAKR